MGTPIGDAEGVPAYVLDAYGVSGAEIEALSGGRTNRTMRVRAGHDLVLQHLRANASDDLIGLMENLVRLTAHLDWKHRTERLVAPGRPSGPNSPVTDSAGTDSLDTWWPHLVPTRTGKPYLMTDDGDVWRAYLYRDGRIARASLSRSSLRSAAALFGRFSRTTLDLDEPLLATSPGFHDLTAVWSTFIQLCDRPERPERLAGVHEHLDELVRLGDRIHARCEADGLYGLRRRVVHNDTKISNVLLHPSGEHAVAVLDLDLAMMGPLWHDVGDFLRSASWYGGGEAPALPPDAAAALLASFVAGAGHAVEAEEIATFAAAGPRLSFELGIRYLADHLRADPVLRVAGADGHLHRGLANVKLATEMLRAYDALRSAVDGLIPGHR